MTRALWFLLRNWPLKLAAIVLASLLYAGLTLSANTHTITVNVPIGIRGEPDNVALLTDLGFVDRISYVGPDDVRVDSSSFQAWVDLSSVVPSAGTVSLPVVVEPVDPRIIVREADPARVNVNLDGVESKTVRVIVSPAPVPQGLQLGDPIVEPESVEVRGPSTLIDQVVEVHAEVPIETSGLNVDRDVVLIPVDSLGERVSPIDVIPETARVTIAVFENSDTRTLPVRPAIIGTPATGYAVTSIEVEPSIVTLEGDAESLAALAAADTAPISVSGQADDFTTTVGLDLPPELALVGGGEISVTVKIQPVTESRSFSAGIALASPRPDRTYALSTDRVLVVLAGSPVDLDALAGRALSATADVTGLDTGEHVVILEMTTEPGVTVVSMTPGNVVVTIGLPAGASASP